MKYVKIAKVDAVGPEEYSMMVMAVADESFDQYLADGYEEATYAEYYVTCSPEVQANMEAPEVAPFEPAVEPEVAPDPEA
jgi:hypothetical protein